MQFMLTGCGTVDKREIRAIESTGKAQRDLTSELKIKRFPLSIKLAVDEKTKNWVAFKKINWANSMSMPVGNQLMLGIKEATSLVFKKVIEDNSNNYDAILRIKLIDFFFDFEITDDGAFFLSKNYHYQYDMSMIVETELLRKDGTKIYEKELAVKNNGISEKWSFPATASTIRTINKVSGEKVNAALVALWIRDLAKDITRDSKVQRFADKVAGSMQIPKVPGPDLSITSLVSGSSTNQATVQLIGSIHSNSPIKDIIISINGRPLKNTRGIVVAPTKTGVVKLDRKIPLSMGENVISITATNEAGGTSQKVISIIRTEPTVVTAADIGRGSKIGERWAVVVGISGYKHSDKGIPNLKNAANDAHTFADFLRSDQGGGFKKDNVLLLTNEQATSSALRRALFTFLKKAIEEDLVIFFFSGQGAPEPGSPENYYLLTYDADPADLPSTAIPTWDIDTAFKRNIKAKRAVIIADASHVSGIGKTSGTRGVVVGGNLINRYLKNLSDSGEGKAIFTATQEGQVNAKARGKGRKTGLFTYYLLEALSGAADENSDGIVTLGEAIDYTTDLVSAASRGKQRPDIAGKFDRNLPLAVLK